MKKAILLFLLANCALADETGVEKYRNFTPKQIADMPEKVRSSEVPVMYIFAARSGMSKGSDTVFAMHLNMLMYPGIHAYEDAVKQFQVDLGDKPSGILTVWQIHNLEQRAELQKLSAVYFPDQFFSSISTATASVQGTFVILDERIAYPVNHAQVSCYKNDGYCKVEQIYLRLPDNNSERYAVNQFDPDYYKITKWTENAIDAVGETAPTACRTTTMNLNFSTKEFYQVTRNTGRDCEVLGQKIPKLERPRIAQIVDGKKIIEKEFSDVQKRAFDALSSSFRKRVADLMVDDRKD